MRYLIDTNVFISQVEKDGELSDSAQAILDNYENIIYISSESVKEFIYLVQDDRITVKKQFRSLEVFDLIENVFGIKVKYVTKEHLRTLVKLPAVENHRDQNDRLSIAQAITEKLPLISSDTKFSKYRKSGLDYISSR